LQNGQRATRRTGGKDLMPLLLQIRLSKNPDLFFILNQQYDSHIDPNRNATAQVITIINAETRR
jgi:hypothetical protein